MLKRGAARAAAASLLLVVLSGCASLPAVDAPDKTPVFEVEARVILRQPQQPARVFVIHWDRARGADGEHDSLEIKNTLGVTLAKLLISPQQAELLYQGKRVTAAGGAQLLERIAGQALPVEALDDWLHARAAPDAPAQTLANAAGEIAQINQSGYEIKYLSYDDERRPKVINITAAGEQPAELNISIRRWRLP